MELLEKALAVALTQIGVREVPLGSNRGPVVEAYLKSVGLGPGYAWCAAFIYWCFTKAALQLVVANPLVKTAGVIDHWRRAPAAVKITAAQARANPELIKPGMIGILLLDKHTGAGHMYMVVSQKGGKLMTVEGNSNNGGSRDGNGVYDLNRRKLSDAILVGFLDYSRILG